MVQENLDGSGDDEWYRKAWMVQETMSGTRDGSREHEWYRKPWMVQETMNGTGDGSGNHEDIVHAHLFFTNT
jgi:hypothetical protein